MKSRRILLIVFVLLLASSVVARADQVDDFITAEMKRQHIPGLDDVDIESIWRGIAALHLPAAPR